MRELQSALKHALVHATGNIIRPEHLPDTILTPFSLLSEPYCLEHAEDHEEKSLKGTVQVLLDRGEKDIYHKLTYLMDADVIPLVIEHTRGNLHQACEILGISRNTLKAKIRCHQLEFKPTVRSKNDGWHKFSKSPQP